MMFVSECLILSNQAVCFLATFSEREHVWMCQRSANVSFINAHISPRHWVDPEEEEEHTKTSNSRYFGGHIKVIKYRVVSSASINQLSAQLSSRDRKQASKCEKKPSSGWITNARESRKSSPVLFIHKALVLISTEPSIYIHDNYMPRLNL